MASSEGTAKGFPGWWPIVVSAVGMGIAIFEAYHNYENWAVSGLAGSMILGGAPAALIDGWLRGRS